MTLFLLLKLWGQTSDKGGMLFPGCDVREKVVTLCDVRKRHHCCILSCSSLKKNKSLNIHRKSIHPHNLTNLYLSLTWEPLHEVSITSSRCSHLLSLHWQRCVKASCVLNEHPRDVTVTFWGPLPKTVN